MSIDPLLISLDDDFTESELFDEFASKFSILTGLFVDGNELKDLFDNICEIIDQDITLQIPGINISLDTTEIEEIASEWDNLDKITSSDISTINNIIFNLDGIDEISTDDIRDVINSISQSIGGLESFFDPLFESVLEFIAKNDPKFYVRHYYEDWILCALEMHVINLLLDVMDAMNIIKPIESHILDEIITILGGIAIGYFGYNAKIETEDFYKEKNAEYIISMGSIISVQAVYELYAQMYIVDEAADLFGTVVEIILDVISVCSTYWHFYEEGDVDWDALSWAIIDGVITFPNAILPLIEKNKKALGACIAASAIGTIFLIIRLTNPGRWF